MPAISPVNRLCQAVNTITNTGYQALGRTVSVLSSGSSTVFNGVYSGIGSALDLTGRAICKTCETGCTGIEKLFFAVTITFPRLLSAGLDKIGKGYDNLSQATGAPARPSGNKLLGFCALASALVAGGVGGLSAATLFVLPYAVTTSLLGTVSVSAFCLTRCTDDGAMAAINAQWAHSSIAPSTQGMIMPLGVVLTASFFFAHIGMIPLTVVAGIAQGGASGVSLSSSIERLASHS